MVVGKLLREEFERTQPNGVLPSGVEGCGREVHVSTWRREGGLRGIGKIQDRNLSEEFGRNKQKNVVHFRAVRKESNRGQLIRWK